MKKLLSILVFIALTLSARADTITATLAITNTPTTGATIANGADSRYWTNGTVTAPATQIAITNNNILLASNLFTHLARARFDLMNAKWDGSTSNIVFKGEAPLALTVSAGWCSVTYFTNTTENALIVQVPFTNFDPTNRTNMASGIVAGVNATSTNAFATNTVAMTNFVDLFNQQTISNKILILATIYGGIISNVTITNATGISGTVSNLTNGTWTNPIFTNGQNFGNPFRSPGGGTGSEQFGIGAIASSDFAIAYGDSATAFGVESSAIGWGSTASGDFSIAFANSTASASGAFAAGFAAVASGAGSTALGGLAAATLPHQIMLGTSAEFVQFPGGVLFTGIETNAILAGTNQVIGQIAFTRTNNTTLANSNNVVDPLSKYYLKVSGPTGAFCISTITRGVDGRPLKIQNSTGQTMVVQSESGFGSAADRIQTPTGADVHFTGNPCIVNFIYDSSISRWILELPQ